MSACVCVLPLVLFAPGWDVSTGRFLIKVLGVVHGEEREGGRWWECEAQSQK